MKTMTHLVRSVIVGVLLGLTAESFAETRVTWVGGTEGDFNVAANWDPAKVPSSEKTTVYIAVFTNSVSFSNTSSYYWYGGGVEVSGNSTVLFSSGRYMPTTAGLGDVHVFDIEEGSSLTFDGSIFYGNSAIPLVKKGGGLLKTTGWFGNSSVAGREFGLVDVQDGTIFAAKGDYRWNCVSNIVVRPSGTFKVATGGGLNQTFLPCATVEAGGTLDLGEKTLTLASLSGAGTVTNGTTLHVTLKLRDPAEEVAVSFLEPTSAGSFGFAINGEKSVIAPIPRKISGG